MVTMLNFADYKWHTAFAWRPVLDSEELPLNEDYASSALCLIGDTQLAVFRSTDNKLYALQNLCGHRIAFVLSEGTLGIDKVTDSTYVMCPLHRRKFFLDGDHKGRTKPGMAKGHSIATFAVKEEEGRIWIELPDVEELDSVLGTHRWLPPRSEGPRPKAARHAFPPTMVRPAAAEINDTGLSAADCTAACGSGDTRSKADDDATTIPPDCVGSNTLPPCHRRGISDTESDSSLSKSPPKEQRDEDSEQPSCPVAKAQALCW